MNWSFKEKIMNYKNITKFKKKPTNFSPKYIGLHIFFNI